MKYLKVIIVWCYKNIALFVCACRPARHRNIGSTNGVNFMRYCPFGQNMPEIPGILFGDNASGSDIIPIRNTQDLLLAFVDL